MQISVFGIGYVGAVSAACLASEGHVVVAVDINPEKVASVNEGRAPLRERGLDELIRTNVEAERLFATTETAAAIDASELSLVCVGTPSRSDGDLDRRDVLRACADIGRNLRRKNDFHTVVVRSTLLPGSTREIVIPTLELRSGKRAGQSFGVAYYPEFLREGTAIDDFHNAETAVLGVGDNKTEELLRDLVDPDRTKAFVTDYATAEAVKYTTNAWHAAKIVFANEIGVFCHASGIDSHKVMEILCADTKLNLSRAYLRPGFAFGGSCLPKDLRALTHSAKSRNLALPMLESLEVSNQRQIRRGYEMVQEAGHRRVGLLGLSFKGGTDDLRESPAVELAKLLYGNGYELRIYDLAVSMAKLKGRNLQYIQEHLPHLDALLTADVWDLLEFAETIVVTTAEYAGTHLSNLRPDQSLVDLVRLPEESRPATGNYQGLCW